MPSGDDAGGDIRLCLRSGAFYGVCAVVMTVGCHVCVLSEAARHGIFSHIAAVAGLLAVCSDDLFV